MFRSAALSPEPAIMTPVLGSDAFPLGVTDPLFKKMKEKGKFRLVHFTENNKLLEANGVRSILGQGADFLHVSQLCSYLRSLPGARAGIREATPFEKLCLACCPRRHALSMIYSMLAEGSAGCDPPFLTRWERELGRSFTEDQKTRILFFAQKASVANKYQENGYKIVTRWYHTPVVLHRMFPQTSSQCWRCEQEEGSLLHIFWGCHKISSFWSSVRDVIQEITGMCLQLSPEIFLFHLAPMGRKKYKKSLIIHLLNAAKACISACWKQTDPPTVGHWLGRVREIQLMEAMTQSLRESPSDYGETWAPWFEYERGAISSG